MLLWLGKKEVMLTRRRIPRDIGGRSHILNFKIFSTRRWW
jgi:hypothetical protein